MNPLAELLIALLGAGASELASLTKGGVKEGATLSADFISVLMAVLRRHAANQGKTIEEVIAEL